MMIANEDVTFFQEFFVKFYQAFIEADRWLQYLNGVKTTLIVTALALILGICLGFYLAVDGLRTSLKAMDRMHRTGADSPANRILHLWHL